MRNLCAITAAALLWISCEAPRTNPFDPSAENHIEQQEASLYVGHLSMPSKALAGAMVTETRLGFFGKTAPDGTFSFSTPDTDSLRFMIQKEGFFAIDTTLEVNTEQRYELFLNALPVFEQVQFVSRYTASGNAYVVATAELSDPDGILDVRSALIKQADLDFSANLLPQLDNGQDIFQREINIKDISSQLSTTNISEYDFYFVVNNQNGDSLQRGPFVIRRVIDKKLTPLKPNLQNPAAGSVEFGWQPESAGFDFHYRIELYNSNFEFLTAIDPIPGDSSSYVLSNQDVLSRLSATGNFWLLFMVDNPGNNSQSFFTFFDYSP